jgi:bleomycin hydrolase
VLGPELLTELREGYIMSASDRACHNAVTNNSLDALALNREALRCNDGHFSHRIQSNGITDQKQSGRCWIFAGLNTLLPRMMHQHRMEDFQFSTAYLQFWDKLEKSNLYLESIIELRDASYLDRDWEMVNKHSMEDGGWWNYLTGLIQKYGVVPLTAMPETRTSANTATFNIVLGRMLRVQAAKILKQHANGAGVDQLRTMKQESLKEIYRFLVINFGEPPERFEWRYQLRKEPTKASADATADMSHPHESSLTPIETHTPHSFFERYVANALEDQVCLYNDPNNELHRHYYFDRARNIVGSECMHFVNIDTAQMKEIAKASILANEPLWFAVKMDFDQSKEHGLMDHQLFDYETLFQIDLTMDKAERTRFHAGASNHAMVLMGVDLDSNGIPVKWLVENSHGETAGDKGRWTILDRWFDEHVYTIIVHKRHVPAEILKHFEEKPAVLPAWYPGARHITTGG